MTHGTPHREEELWEYKSPAHELGLWLLALRSFFQANNHPLNDAERNALNQRDFFREARIARQCLLGAVRLTLRLLPDNNRVEKTPLLDEAEAPDDIGEISLNNFSPATLSADTTQEKSLTLLANSLTAAWAVCDSLLANASINFHTWNSIRRLVEGDLAGSAAARTIMREAQTFTLAHIPSPLQPLLAVPLVSPLFDADLHNVFVWLTRLRSRLKVIEKLLQYDQPLKQTLPVFTLIHEETRRLMEFMQNRLLTYEGISTEIFETLDGTAYAIQMETRKVFSHELVGFSALRPAPAVYAKIETAHGLLRNSFQESTVVLARLFAPDLEGAVLFHDFQTRLQQSLMLRSDLWSLLQLLQRAERERGQFPIERLLAKIEHFRVNSLNFLMYKDLESCERFMEEVTMAEGTAELAPVLHRFAAYLETLHGQVNMRGVLANHPFDYPRLED